MREREWVGWWGGTATIVQQENARLAANDAMLYIFSYGPSVCSAVGVSVCSCSSDYCGAIKMTCQLAHLANRRETVDRRRS